MLMSSIKQTYGAFVKENRLTAERAERFFDVLLDQAMGDWDDSANFFAGDKDDPTGEEAQAAAAAWAESEQQLQEFLSKDEYATYQEYNKSISERTALEQIRRELASNSEPLSEDQANFLFQVLRDERLKSAPVAFDPRSAGRTRDISRIALEGDNGARYLETQADINQRVLARAEAILSAEQYEALATFQRQHLEVERTGIEYTRKVMAKKNAGN
ncbi:MAG: hypothetical protein ACJ8NS_01595 [Chthoniobacterales bacterium]